MNLHVFQHDACEGPGIIADWARARGHAVTATHFYRGGTPPAPTTVDCLLVMGGPMNIYQDRDHPWLRGERAFIEAHIRGGKSAIGICLGAQFLADALGARVTQNPQLEIGWFPVDFTAEAQTRFPFLPPSLEVLHWHGDTFDLPSGAMRLATSAACANQGFLYDDRVLALQFHPEMTPEVAAGLVAEGGAALQPDAFVQTSDAILAQPEAVFSQPNKLLYDLLDAVWRAAG
ncbi:MAG: type 1 glutamine amidotransferase [Terrimicrobiaceae bacterium]|nr:type 1 glutamine amidotransferase [Terrimicrobiaceae bacterium]